jgi:hypothetical protein
MRFFVLFVLALSILSSTAAAERRSNQECLRALAASGVEFEQTKRSGIATGVILGTSIDGVEYRSFGKRPLVIDCSLAYSLVASTRFLKAHGITQVLYSSAYSRRKIRRTNRWSKHSYGLAIDLHAFVSNELGSMEIKDDYEQGLGDSVDCLGRPLTTAGGVLRALTCQFTRSGLFRIILDPDFDADHYNHFHVEALPWNERVDELRF